MAAFKRVAPCRPDSWQKTETLVAALDIAPEMTVTDRGTGSGYMLPHLVRAVGPDGVVIAHPMQARQALFGPPPTLPSFRRPLPRPPAEKVDPLYGRPSIRPTLLDCICTSTAA